MKYNKQLFDQIEKEYNHLFDLSIFIFDQMLEKNEEINRYEIISEFDLYIQAVLAKTIMDNHPKNPALFNILKKLSRFVSFYQGINLDDWFKEKDKVLRSLSNKINQVTSNIPSMIKIAYQMDKKTGTTELVYQLLEGMISLVITIIPDIKSFEDAEKEIINQYYKEIYELIQK